MKDLPSRIISLLRITGVLYFFYFICRFLFYLCNRGHFAQMEASDFITDAFYGLRFDSFSIIASNLLFLLLYLSPLGKFTNKLIRSFIRIAFMVPNALFLLFNCIDLGYFQYIHKRSGADLFKQAGGQTDLVKLLPQYAADFWWILLLYLGMIFALRKAYKTNIEHAKPRIITWGTWKLYLSLLVLAGALFLGLRGGIQRNPIDIVHAGGMTKAEEVPVVLNTPFTIIKTLGQESLREYRFYSETDLKKKFDPVHYFKDSTFTRKNIVVVILESFAKEYTGLGKMKSYTPFLDSLTGHGLAFTNAYANGAKSIEGIPAILSSVPSLMENPIINSSFANNRFTGFANLLNHEGYTTAFFHGGINGTMNFDVYAKLAGYKEYYGRNEYGDDRDFDGYWGIWDEPFLQFTVKKMSSFKEPFHSSIFTLSSHHPYKVPEKYKGKFPMGHLENLESVGYADYALRLFFDRAKKEKWFKNTLFVLCADHCCLSDDPFYKNTVGLKSIPIVFYSPDNKLSGKYGFSFSQMDIFPSVMQLLGYQKPFFSLGRSFGEQRNDCCFYYENGLNYTLCDSMLLSYSGTNLKEVYNFKRDSALKNNCKGKYFLLEARMDEAYKAFIQTYCHVLIHDSAFVER